MDCHDDLLRDPASSGAERSVNAPAWRHRVVWAVAVLTIATGAAQIVVPGWMLVTIGAERTPTTAHLFGTVGMLMVLFGGALDHALRRPVERRIVVLWAGIQKIGAVVAVGLGVARGIFSSLALCVAGFDLLSAVFILWLFADLSALS
jgi:hypothetical protein